MHRTTARLMAASQPVSWLGANFWSRAGGPLMWRTYDPAVISAELRVLRVLREHGLAMTRSFFYWPDFMPEPGAIDEEMTARFADFPDLHVEQQMSTVPTFIVGHMSGQNWDPSWRAGRDLLTDVWLGSGAAAGGRLGARLPDGVGGCRCEMYSGWPRLVTMPGIHGVWPVRAWPPVSCQCRGRCAGRRPSRR